MQNNYLTTIIFYIVSNLLIIIKIVKYWSKNGLLLQALKSMARPVSPIFWFGIEATLSFRNNF